MRIKMMALLVLVLGHVCLANATNRKMMDTKRETEDYTDTVAVSAVAAAPDEEEMKNHHSIPRRAWDDSQDQDQDETGAPDADNRA